MYMFWVRVYWCGPLCCASCQAARRNPREASRCQSKWGQLIQWWFAQPWVLLGWQCLHECCNISTLYFWHVSDGSFLGHNFEWARINSMPWVFVCCKAVLKWFGCQATWDSCPLYCLSQMLLAVSLEATWLILPVVICLSQRLSHACLSISFYTVKLRMAH